MKEKYCMKGKAEKRKGKGETTQQTINIFNVILF